MRLLFDQNLSPHLVNLLEDIFPDSTHVADAGLDRSSDNEIWKYAQTNGYTIVSKDSDFSEMSVLRGFPPKVIGILLGNCPTARIENLLRENQQRIEELNKSENVGSLLLY